MEPSLIARVTTFPLSLEINLLSSIPKTAIFSTKIILLVSIPHYSKRKIFELEFLKCKNLKYLSSSWVKSKIGNQVQ